MPTYAENLISTVTVGAGGASSIDFTSIPATYTDLKVVISGRTNRATVQDSIQVQFNSDTGNNYSYRRLYGASGTASSDTNTGDSNATAGYINGNSGTANTFGNCEFYVANYAGNTYKSISSYGVSENGGSASSIGTTGSMWSNTSAITSMTIKGGTGANFQQYTTAYLYGITGYAETGATSKATGGVVTSDSTYYYHTFKSTGMFTPLQSLTADILVVAGGGAGSGTAAAGGGAGGLVGLTSQSLTANTKYSVLVGAGGGYTVSTVTNGTDSKFGSLTTAVGGGGGGSRAAGQVVGGTGGSGGGRANASGSAAGSGTAGQGNAGGANIYQFSSSGGGGASASGADGTSSSGGAGGAGSSAYSSWGSATSTGQNVSGTYYYAGGGGGGGNGNGSLPGGAGGSGGGGAGGNGTQTSNAGAGTAGTANTGGGGGGGGQCEGAYADGAGSNGGSGIVIVRYAK